MKSAVFFLVSVLAATWNIQAAEVDVNPEVQRFSQMYFAQMDGANFFRLYDPKSGMVEFRRNWKTGGIDGAAGWRAEKVGETMTVSPPGASVSFSFVKGRPDTMSIQGKKVKMQFEEEPSMPGRVAEMWEGAAEEAIASKIWDKSRFTLFYVNPNHTALLLALLGIVALWGFLRCEKPWAMAACALVAVVTAWLLVKTGGRGGFLAFAVGGAVVYGCRFLRKGARRRMCLLGILAVLAGGFVVAGGRIGRVSSRLEEVDTRLETWKVTPLMMVDSPSGWGDTPSGKAYSDWYQPLNNTSVTPTLTSDHLTYMVDFGWFGRFLWVFSWLAALALLARFSLREGALPFALFLALGTAAMFNPVLHMKSLWILPVASLFPFVLTAPWREARKMIVPCMAALTLSLAIIAGFWLVGRSLAAKERLSVHTDGERVFVGSDNPGIWIVDDRYTLGWLFAPKEIRYFYSRFPAATVLGYTEKIAAVPRHVRRLVVAGKRCREYVKAWQKGAAPKADELVFVSPGMPIKSIPARLRASCRFKMVVGEFAARYADEYGSGLEGSDEVVIIEGAEIYIPGWVGLILTQL